MVQGRVATGAQYHFHLENQVALCEMDDVGDGVKVKASTQWLDYTQGGVAQVLGLPEHKSVLTSLHSSLLLLM